jgi:hypothetical protein
MRLPRATGMAGRGIGLGPSQEIDHRERGKELAMSQNVTLLAKILPNVL